MIGRLTGVLAEKNPPQIVLDVNGVGYELDVPMSTFYNLPASGEKTTLLTHFAVREDGHYLYGFLSEAAACKYSSSSLNQSGALPRRPHCTASCQLVLAFCMSLLICESMTPLVKPRLT